MMCSLRAAATLALVLLIAACGGNPVISDSPPEAPGSLTAELTPNIEALLRWTAPTPSSDRAPVTGYRVYLEGADGLISALGDTQSLSYRHTGLSPGNRYVFHVRALSLAGPSGPSASAFVDVPLAPMLPPEAPGSLTAELTPNNEALLQWTAPAPSPDRAPVTRYRVYLDSAGGLATPLGETGSLSYRHADDLLPGRTYVYHVRADSKSGASLPSASASVHVPGRPIAPVAVPHVSVRADQGRSREVIVSWVHRFEPLLSTVVTGFELEYCEVPHNHSSDHCPGGDWSSHPRLSATTREFTDRDFAVVEENLIDCNSEARMYRMRAIASDSSASSRFSVPTPPICPARTTPPHDALKLCLRCPMPSLESTFAGMFLSKTAIR